MQRINPRQSAVLLFSLALAAVCGIIYELIISSISSYLLGNSVYQFSITIGVFMFAMGLGSLATKYFNARYIENFIIVELLLALMGGLAGLILFLMFPYARGYYEVVNILLIMIIGGLVGMEIPILTTAFAQYKSTKTSIADVMGFDYIGALIGSVIFPIILLPYLGLLESAFVVGFINLLIAFVTIYAFKDTLKFNSFVYIFSIIVFITLLTGIIFSTQLSRFAEKHLYFDQVVFSKQTQYQKLTLTSSKHNADHRLYIDGHIQFSSKDEYIYHEYLTHPTMSIPGSIDNVLILGGGDGLALREILKYDKVKQVTLVDIDPEMINFGSNFPMMKRLNLSAFDDPRVSTIAMDAFTYLNQKGPIFDRVIIDMPDPHNESLNKLYTVQFYKLIKRRMSESGVLVSQSSSPFFTRNTYWSIQKTLNDVFKITLSYNKALPSFGIWGFHIASNNNINLQKINTFPLTRSISKDSLIASTVFSKDISKPEIKLKSNSLMKPSLYITYNNDLRN